MQKNEVRFQDDVVLIKMTNCDDWAVIDAADYPKVKDLKWWKDRLTENGYAVCRPSRKVCEERGFTYGRGVYMHRVINETPDGMVTDHKDGDKLNNRRSNLRTCTQKQNTRNKQKTRKNTTSQYKGVRFIKKYANKPTKRKWEANIMVNGKCRYIGSFESEVQAALAYDLCAFAEFGEFARLNFPHIFTPQPTPSLSSPYTQTQQSQSLKEAN